MGIQVFNISLNQNDFAIGKTGFVYLNEIETVIEFIVEVCITGQDTIPETQIPGGSLGFEEEEKHLHQKSVDIEPSYVSNHLYNDPFSPYAFNIKDHIVEITTPPPRV